MGVFLRFKDTRRAGEMPHFLGNASGFDYRTTGSQIAEQHRQPTPRRVGIVETADYFSVFHNCPGDRLP